jgi:uncharacterized protein (TIRG00374 family)
VRRFLSPRILAGLVLSAGLLYAAARGVAPGELLHRLGETRWSLLVAAVASHLLMIACRGVRWRLLFHPDSPRVGPLVSATLLGYTVNNVLPLRAGELVRAYLATRATGTAFLTTIATLTVERLLDALPVFATMAAVVFVVPVPAFVKTGAIILLAVQVTLTTVVFLLALEWAPVVRGLPALLARVPRVGERLARWLTAFSAGVRCLRPGPHLPGVVGWTVMIWVFNTGTIWAALHAAGVAVPLSAAVTVLVFAGVGVSLPSAPGFVGTFHFFVAQALALFGVSKAAALNAAVLYHAAVYVPVTILGGLLIAIQGVSLTGAVAAVRARARAATDSAAAAP